MKNVDKKTIITVVVIFLICLTTVIINEVLIKNDFNISSPTETVVENNSIQYENKNTSKIFKTYKLENHTLTLNNNNTYLIKGSDYSFEGSFELYNFDTAIKKEFIKKSELAKYGLPVNKINTNNLFYIKAIYSQHVMNENSIEYYSQDLFGAKSFDYLIYFREDNGNMQVAAKNINNNFSDELNKAYF